MDLQILGQRHKDIKNGLSTPPRMTVPNIINLATKPRWCLAMLGTKRRTFRNIVGHAKGVGDRIEVLMDGGIRSGQDVIKALALGAKGVFIGRAFLYGLGAGGEAGVTQCLDIIRKELDVTMALCGLHDVTLVSADILVETPYGLNAGTHLQPGTVRARAV